MMVKLTPLEAWIQQKISHRQVHSAHLASLTRETLKAWQLEKVNETLRHARASSFYQRLLADMPEALSHLDEVRRLPFTRDEDVRKQPLQMVCVSQSEIERVVTLQTSGTTGEPKRIFFTAGDQELTVDFFGVGMSTLTEPGDRVMILLPYQTPGSVGDLLRLGLERTGRLPLPYGPVRESSQAVGTMEEQQPDCLVGSPTQILGLARRWRGGKAPRTVLLSTDTVPKAIVKILEETWQCRVFNHYGMTEMGLGGGVECEAHLGYHLREADLLFEIVDPESGELVPDGEYGEVVFTTLTRVGMPLIRYRTGDRSRFLTDRCPCGTTLRLMERVSGRFSGFFPIGNQTLTLPDLDEAIFPIPGVLNFSVTLGKGDGRRPQATVEVQTLTGEDCPAQVEQALRMIPALEEVDLKVVCKETPGEPGSLTKRVILIS